MSVRIGSQYHHTGGQEHRLIQYIMHPQYEEDYIFDYDVAVMEVEGLMGGEHITPVPLSSTEPLPPQQLYVIGWGALEWQGDGPYRLQYVRIPVVDRQVCKDAGYYDYIRPR